MMRINGIPLWLYRLQFIVAGVLILRTNGWPLRVAWSCVAADFDNDSHERHEGYSPAESAAEALTYWN